MLTPPDRIVVPGRSLVGLGLAAFGVQQVLFRDFVPGRAPAWPADLPGRLPVAYLSGAVLLVAGIALLADRRPRAAALSAAAMIFAWAFLRHLPEVLASPHGLVLTNAGKALALFGGLVGVAGVFPRADPRPPLILFGHISLGLFMILAGLQHFLFAEFVATLVPAWVPGHLFWTYVAGVALIAGGAGMMVPPTARLAAALSGLMIFLWVVLLHIPRALAAAPAQSRNEWTALAEAISYSGIALVLSGRERADGDHSPPA